MFDREDRVKEIRTIEATKKGYMGLTGKLACVVRNMGSAMVSETPDLYSATFMDDPWELPSDRDPYDGSVVHDPDENAWSRKIGYLFDGLGRGMHLEIRYMSDDKSLTVHHQGHMVYKEVSGDLYAYAPSPDWEGMIDRLYPVAKAVADESKERDAEAAREEAEKRYAGFVEKLKLRWGL